MNCILLNRISPEEVEVAAHQLWPNPEISFKIALETISILNRTFIRKCAFFSGKSSHTLIAGLFYLLGLKYDEKRIKKKSPISLELMMLVLDYPTGIGLKRFLINLWIHLAS